VSILVGEARQKRLLALIEQDPKIAVWWGTPVEICSAISRQERAGHMTASKASDALVALEALTEGWQEVLPTSQVRKTAKRLVRVHPLRAADAPQLAAALTALDGSSASGALVCLDDRLTDAARREGLQVLP
jgi:hypothetical protein